MRALLILARRPRSLLFIAAGLFLILVLHLFRFQVQPVSHGGRLPAYIETDRWRGQSRVCLSEYCWDWQ